MRSGLSAGCGSASRPADYRKRGQAAGCNDGGDAGITRGPAVKLVSPDPAAESVKSPFSLKVVFEPRGGAKIDPASVRLSYLKSPAVDLTDRVRPGLSERGIQLDGAEVPPGEHQIRVTVQDTEGRQGSTVIHLKIVK